MHDCTVAHHERFTPPVQARAGCDGEARRPTSAVSLAVVRHGGGDVGEVESYTLTHHDLEHDVVTAEE
ncbi:hypothetical protein GCM10022376_26150 [Yimella lutea]